jgi:hypothetical protein
MPRESVTLEMKQVRNFLDVSLRAHLAAKGALCPCCELPKGLCRCISRENHIRVAFQPAHQRANG